MAPAKKERMTDLELQQGLLEWNFLNSPGAFDEGIRDMARGRGKEVEKETILQAYEREESRKKEEEDENQQS